MAWMGRLAPPLLANYTWQYRGACNGVDPEGFFVESQRGSTKGRREAAAKAVCGRCPVVRECLEHALAADEPYGIWGGLTVQERQALRTRVG